MKPANDTYTFVARYFIIYGMVITCGSFSHTADAMFFVEHEAVLPLNLVINITDVLS